MIIYTSLFGLLITDYWSIGYSILAEWHSGHIPAAAAFRYVFKHNRDECLDATLLTKYSLQPSHYHDRYWTSLSVLSRHCHHHRDRCRPVGGTTWRSAWSTGELYGHVRPCSTNTAGRFLRRADLADCSQSAVNIWTATPWQRSRLATSCPWGCPDIWRPGCWCYNGKCVSGMWPVLTETFLIP